MPNMTGRSDRVTACPRALVGRTRWTTRRNAVTENPWRLGARVGGHARTGRNQHSPHRRPADPTHRVQRSAWRSWVCSGVLSCGEKSSDTDLQLSERQFGEWRATTEEQEPIRYVSVRENDAQAAPEAIAGHRIPQCAADHKGHLRRHDGWVSDKRAPHGCTPDADAIAPKADKCVTVTDAIDQADRSGGQTGPALVATGLEHSAAGAGAHAGTKAVFTVPAAVVRLKCALHDNLFRTFRAKFRKVTLTSPPNVVAMSSRGLTQQCYDPIGATPNHRVNHPAW